MINFGSISSYDQKENLFLTQQIPSVCNVVCQNIASNTSIDLINTNIEGDISITKSCSTNGSCTVDTSSVNIEEDPSSGTIASNSIMSSAVAATRLKDDIKTPRKQKGSILYFILIIAVLLIAFFIAKSLLGISR